MGYELMPIYRRFDLILLVALLKLNEVIYIVHLAHTHTQTNVWVLPTNVQYFGGHFRPHNFPKIWHHLCTFPIVSNSSAVSYAWFAIWNALCLGLIVWPGPSQGLKKSSPRPLLRRQPFVITSTTMQDVKTDFLLSRQSLRKVWKSKGVGGKLRY